jgi:urease accessory protein
MIRLNSHIKLSALTLAVCALASPAYAHHVMDGQLPQTFMQGLLSGFGHPVIGLDHFAFVVAMGLIASAVPKGLRLLAVFIGGALLGCVIHLFAVDLPLAEIVIATSVLAAGLVLMAGMKLSATSFAIAAGTIGVFHGYAYGESIVGAEASALGAYLVGFSLIQFAIAAGAYFLVGALRRRPMPRLDDGLRLAGVVIGGFGLFVLSGHLIA